MILLVDDDATGRQVALYNLTRAGFEVEEVADGAAALERFDPQRHRVVVTDLKMPGASGLDVLREVTRRAPGTPVVVMTAFGSVDHAVEAMRAGAWDFLEKPFSRERLDVTVRRAVEAATLRSDNQRLRVERPIVAASEAMAEVLRVTDRVARSDAAVLVHGESGVGKELIARRLHARSRRAAGPFVPINCAAIPGELLEAELFGHSKGAFTGAGRAREGRFRKAHGGTAFLDEVGELPMAVQAKLLRVLQEGDVDVLGVDEPVSVDVRVVAATNRDLREAVDAGTFREDLYWRLDVVSIRVPPLRERPGDIEPLARSFLPEHLDLPADVLDVLRQRSWPGNVRELKNACERMAILAPGRSVRVDDLAARRAGGDWLDRIPADLSLVDIEAAVIQHALDREGGNVSAAARQLGVPRHVLVYRIQKHGLRT